MCNISIREISSLLRPCDINATSSFTRVKVRHYRHFENMLIDGSDEIGGFSTEFPVARALMT